MIDLAVGEVGPMMMKAKKTRLDMFYELTADLEVFKLQLLLIFNRCCFISPAHYEQNDLTKQWRWFKRLKKQVLETYAREVDDDDISSGSDDEETDNPPNILDEIKKTMQQMNKSRLTESKKSVDKFPHSVQPMKIHDRIDL